MTRKGYHWEAALEVMEKRDKEQKEKKRAWAKAGVKYANGRYRKYQRLIHYGVPWKQALKMDLEPLDRSNKVARKMGVPYRSNTYQRAYIMVSRKGLSWKEALKISKKGPKKVGRPRRPGLKNSAEYNRAYTMVRKGLTWEKAIQVVQARGKK